MRRPKRRRVVTSALLLLFACGPGERRTAAPAAPAVDGAAIFRQQCALCHGADGRGQTGFGAAYPNANLADAKWARGNSREAIAKTIRDGIPATPMPPFGPALSPAEIDAVTTHVMQWSQ